MLQLVILSRAVNLKLKCITGTFYFKFNGITPKLMKTFLIRKTCFRIDIRPPKIKINNLLNQKVDKEINSSTYSNIFRLIKLLFIVLYCHTIYIYCHIDHWVIQQSSNYHTVIQLRNNFSLSIICFFISFYTFIFIVIQFSHL